jgi:transcriptional regulator with XRE-family HTH domain
MAPARGKCEREASTIAPSLAKAFGTALRKARLEASLSQADIAEASGIMHNRISPIEHGKVDLRLSTAGKLARAVGRSVKDLLPD